MHVRITQSEPFNSPTGTYHDVGGERMLLVRKFTQPGGGVELEFAPDPLVDLEKRVGEALRKVAVGVDESAERFRHYPIQPRAMQRHSSEVVEAHLLRLITLVGTGSLEKDEAVGVARRFLAEEQNALAAGAFCWLIAITKEASDA